jgi:hypothetical protein
MSDWFCLESITYEETRSKMSGFRDDGRAESWDQPEGAPHGEKERGLTFFRENDEEPK